MATRAPTGASVLRHIQGLAKQEQYAAGLAMRDTAFEIRRQMIATMREVFDRPTPFVLRSVRVRDYKYYQELSAFTLSQGLGPGRTAGALETVIDINPDSPGNGPSPERILLAEVYGGTRHLKGAERQLQAAGLMPGGWFMLPTSRLLADRSKVDQYGNVRGSFIQRLLSYLRSYTQAGYEANAKRSTLARVARRGRTGDFGPERYVRPGLPKIFGVVYFVTGGPRQGEKKTRHLPPGIWAKSGIQGQDIYPIFLFKPTVHYQVRLRYEEIARNIAQRTFPERFKIRFDQAIATARW